MDDINKPCQLCQQPGLQKFEIPQSSVLWFCQSCELYQYGMLVDEEAYASKYHQGYARHRQQKIRTARMRLNRILPLLNSNPYDASTRTPVRGAPHLLDVGCSVGATLEAAASIGWNSTGVDVSQDAVDFCKKNSLNAIKVDGLELPFDDESFDVVVNWHVIEHVEDVRDTLAEWNRVLRPGGLLVMETPDASSPKVRRLGPRYRKFWAPEHTYTFTYQNLSRFLQQSGFSIESKPVFGPIRKLGWKLSPYAVAYQTYHGLRKLAGIQKAFQIFSRKVESPQARLCQQQSASADQSAEWSRAS